MDSQSCSIQPAGQKPIKELFLKLESKVSDYQQAMALAKTEAEREMGEYMLMSWYDRDRDFESPPNTTECAGDCAKDGYIHYGINHGATFKVDIDNV